MKKNFRYATVALTVMALMTACNNNANEEVPLDTLPAIDTAVIEEVTDTVAADTVEAESAPVKAVKKAVKKEVDKTVKAATIAGKKMVETVTDELKKGEGNSVSVGGTKSAAKGLGTGKKPASEQTFDKK